MRFRAKSLGAKTHEMFLEDGDRKVTFLKIRALNLYVISDARGFGNNWIKVSHTDKTFDSVPLMGPDTEQNMTSIARFFASAVIKHREQLIGVIDMKKKKKTDMLFSISLRDTSPKVIREIKEEFQKLLDL